MFKSERVILRINGVDWEGWKSVQITRSVEAIAGGFSLGLTDRWSYDSQPLPIAAGMSCQILAGDAPLIDGFVDKVSHSFSATDHGITVEGRDKSGDLVDCAAVHSPGQWKGLKADQLASIFAQPFGVAVHSDAAVGGPFATYQLKPGEKALDALRRVCKQRELLALPNGKGDIVLAKLGQNTCPTSLVQGKNLLTMQANFDASQRHSHYIVQGQKKGTDKNFGAACSVKGSVEDNEITRYRPMMLRAAEQGDVSYMRKRALWERTIRRAKGTSVKVTVQGWRMGDGQLWPLGWLVPVNIPYMGIDQTLLIAKVTLTKGMEGTRAELELKDKDAFAPEPEKPEGKGGGGSSDLSLFVKQSQEVKARGEVLQGAL